MNKLIAFIKSLFIKADKYNPDDFRLKLEFTNEQKLKIYFLYSVNKGKNWKKIYSYKSPFMGLLENDYRWEPYSVKFNERTNLEYEFETFSSFEKIKKYEDRELKNFNEKNEEHIHQREEYYNRKIEKLDEINNILNKKYQQIDHE